jgi:hypothetical protein
MFYKHFLLQNTVHSDANFFSGLNEEIQSMLIYNESAIIYWGKPGFFANNTDDQDVTICNWTIGEGRYMYMQQLYSPIFSKHFI